MTHADHEYGPIPPALTREEWEVNGYRDTTGYAVATVSGVTVGDRTTELGEEIVGVRNPRRHALAALCLYEQPFGFTDDDLGLLRTVADKIVLGLHGLQVERGDPHDDEEHASAVDTVVARLHALANRIAALLPA